VIKTETDLRKVLKELEKASIVAVDVETDGLNVRKNKVIGLGFSTDTGLEAYATTTDHMKTLAEALSGKLLIAWNAYFDLEMIKNNFSVDLWDSLHADVVCLKHTVEEEPPFALKEVSKKVFGHDATKEQEELKASIKKNGGTPTQFFKADTEVLAKYCIQDCKLTLKLYDIYIDKVKDEGLSDFFFNDEVMPLYKEVTRHMMNRGIKIDIDRAQKLQKAIKLDIDALEKKIQKQIEPLLDHFTNWFLNKDYKPSRTGNFAQGAIALSGLDIPKTKSGRYTTARMALEPYKNNRFVKYMRGDVCLQDREIRDIQTTLWKQEGKQYMFNLLSKHHLKKIFFDTLQEKPLTRTEKGAPQVNDDFLAVMAKKYDWVSWLQDYNKLIKLKSTYIERVLDLQEDGIFYPQFHQHRTISGRYGSDLQQLPRPVEAGELSPLVSGYRNQIRELFIAKEGDRFIDADYESLEPHIFAHVSGEDSIKEIFTKGHDFYSTIAIAVEGVDASADKAANNYLGKVNKTLRQRAKAYSLGIPYGLESFALSKQLNISQHKAEILIENYKKGFPSLANWMEESNKQVELYGRVSSQAGRVRRFSRQQAILKSHGQEITDTLALYEKYKDDPKLYENMKALRRSVKNALNNAKNFQIQSLAASVTNRACIAINRYMKENRIPGCIVAQIHDQIIVECPERRAPMMQKVVQDLMEASMADVLSVKLKAPAEISRNFAEGH